MSQTPSGRVYQGTIAGPWAANAASRGPRGGDSHRGWRQGFSVWCASIRGTGWGESVSTPPLRTTCRASATLSQGDQDRPTTSGRAR